MSIIPPPPKPYTPGLDFANRRYVDPAAQFDHECSEALDIIKAKLQVLLSTLDRPLRQTYPLTARRTLPSWKP